MPKNIAVCADGTGNSSIIGRGTNVFKLYEAVDQNGHRVDRTLRPQVAVYHDGVGTESFRWWRAFTGATGFGLARNVRQLYTAIARLYEPGDGIYLFGFSRGAFTVRTLAGLIDTCGIIDVRRCETEAALRRTVSRAYAEYRRKYQVVLSRLVYGPRQPRDEEFRAAYSVHDSEYAPDGRIAIEFIGVWDTVDAVGLPFHIADFLNSFVHRFKFTDRKLSARVKRACHALAIDEQRESFAPVLWQQMKGDDRIQQVWFAGVHSNVGGGYPKQGMSLVTLDWMLMNAEKAGLRFVPSQRLFSQQCHSVDDELYDSRAGVGILYRWKPRNIARLCREHHVAPKVHQSAFERAARATAGYAPGNVPGGCEVVCTTHPLPGLERISTVSLDLTGSQTPLTNGVKNWIGIALASYYVFLTAIVLVAALLFRYGSFALSSARAGRYTAALPTTPDALWIGLGSVRMHIVFIVIGFVLAFGGSAMANANMESFFSAAWHDVQPRLRKLLGL